MERKKSESLLGFFFAILCVSEIALIIVEYASGVEMQNAVVHIVDILACVAAFVYCIRGQSKRVAIFFKAFCALFTLSVAIILILDFQYAYKARTSDIKSILNLVFLAIAFLSMCIITLGRDIGKKWSYLLATLVLVASCGVVVILFFQEVRTAYLMLNIFRLFFPIILFANIVAKYKDKEARGSH